MPESHPTHHHPNFVDITGHRFGRLSVLRVSHRGTKKDIFWECRCDCGGTKVASGGNLRAGHTQSCGCLQKQRARETSTTHGLSHTPHRGIWNCMLNRCYKPNASYYEYYGGRGIRVCERWRNSLAAFVEDMGPRPAGMTLNRIDNDGNYEPTNCEWATPADQSRNRRCAVLLTFRGKTQIMMDWAKETGLRFNTILARLKRGWTVEQALTIPSCRGRKIAVTRKPSS